MVSEYAEEKFKKELNLRKRESDFWEDFFTHKS